ncbi:hypothetical protein GSN00_11360 [Cylindrospermopsis raciborskii CHAB3438]|uniref:hypothetical protein n=1 Tax=Cylindrospermopsis raciborskii TaxID=77022 RepID=UPI001F0E411C|nr:hypothetical protein [Cylindrospermopsis raciborskii]MCH4904958.1 hypothetical protein [Cylindrospermopsis raciborskii CHAB3438]MEB3146445.1 hypothetical protein [Cylindrospermopsis raciborskii]
MKKLFTALAITSTFVIIQGCASIVKSDETPNSNTTTVSNTNPHEGHHNMENSHHEHSGDSKLELPNATARLTLPDKISPRIPVLLAIDVKDNEGKAIASFDTFQEEVMHLIVVSDDLQSFQHTHPRYKGNGRFEVETDFPYPGNFSLFSDYKVAGKAEQVSVLKAKVPGQSPAKPKIDLAPTKTVETTQVSLKSSQSTIKAGQEVHLIFNLQDTVTKKPPTDLKPYLGERGHLVIIKQSSNLTGADYIHAHAMKNTPDHKVYFITSFPKPGKYKMWGQFNRGGKIVTADFWVNVI